MLNSKDQRRVVVRAAQGDLERAYQQMREQLGQLEGLRDLQRHGRPVATLRLYAQLAESAREMGAAAAALRVHEVYAENPGEIDGAAPPVNF